MQRKNVFLIETTTTTTTTKNQVALTHFKAQWG